MKTILFIVQIIILSFIFSCNQTDKSNASIQHEVKKIATEYFDTYAERSDWEKLLSFYSPEMKFEDIILQIKLDNFDAFKKFYDWPNPGFQKLSPEQKAMVVETLVVDETRVAVAKGYFNPFIWQGEKIDPQWGMEFTMWLYFDENLKIVRQVDWIEYDESVLESVVNNNRNNE